MASSVSLPQKKRPSERSKLIVSVIFAGLLAALGYYLSFYTSNKLSITGYLVLASFLAGFVFTGLFQALQQCPFNPVTVSVASASIAAVVLLTAAILYFSVTGNFCMSIVTAAFPIQVTEDVNLNEMNTNSRGYSYWMFWAGLLPMYIFLGLAGSC